MTITVSPTEEDVLKSLRGFLAGVLPSGTPVIKAQVNRVPQPSQVNFVLMTPRARPRLRTNVNTSEDCAFTASIAGTVMTVTAVALGAIEVGATLFGVDVEDDTTVVAQVSGTSGGVGVYTVSESQTLSSRTLASGGTRIEQGTEIVVQIDVYGPLSGNHAQIVSTLIRDPYGVKKFEDQALGVVPLYADDPQQMPLVDAEKQYEDRWTFAAHLQANPVVRVPQEYADAVSVDLVNVDAAYPPS